MKKWNEYYKEWTVADYTQHVKAVKGFAHRLIEFTPDRGKLIEIGFGTGQISILLAGMGYILTGIDNDQELVERAIRLKNKVLGKNKLYPEFICADVFDIIPDQVFPFYHTAFSQGLLEHFGDMQIKTMLEIQFAIASVVGFSVPLDKFGHQSRGDERLLPKEYWINELTKGYKKLYVSTFANDKQLTCIITKKT